MKKYLLSAVALATLSMQAFAQPACRVVSPASIAGNKTFTWADAWGQTPDFNIPGVFVQDTVAFVDDGSPGTNPQGNPVAQEGCNALVNPNEVQGKIALIYRNTCEFGTKALNAENAGAVAAVIINRDPEAIGMGAGADGPNVTIPVVMITSDDGAAIKAAMQGGPVVMFLGNKQGLNANDLSTNGGVTRIANYAGGHLSLNNSFFPAIEIYNVGSADQAEVSVQCVIDGPNGNVYDETVGPINMLSGDTTYIIDGNPFGFPEFTMAPFEAGDYNITYEITLGSNTDEDLADNVISSDFSINDEWLSMARLDANNDPVANSFPSNSTGIYTNCISLREENISTRVLSGYKFVPEADTTEQLIDITGEEILFKVFDWADTTLVDASVLTEVYTHAYYLDGNNDVRQVIKVDFPADAQFVFDDNTNYLVCLETANGVDIAFGHDNGVDYNGNEAITGQFASPIQVVSQGAETWFTGGWSGVSAPSMTLRLNDISEMGLEENNVIVGVYPNPVNNEVRISSSNNGAAVITVTDLSGKTVSTSSVNFSNGSVNMSTASLESGMYIFNIAYDNGDVTRVNVVKK